MKQISNILIIILIGVQFQSCSTYKVSSLLKKGHVVNKGYLTEIPFKYYKDLIFIEVTINDKKYNFFVDSGAELNVIGQHLTDKINYKVITSSKVNSASKEKQEVEFIELEKVSIQNVDFKNTGAIVKDLSHFNKYVGCEKIDGLIGNNLMRKSNWQIDYKKRIIRITDNIEELLISKNAKEIVLNSRKSGNMYFDVSIDGVKSKFTFDTGYNGKILADKQFLDLLIANNDRLEYTSETGAISTNLHGIVNGTTYSASVKSIDIEGVVINNQIMSIKEVSPSLVGNKFFNNYVLTLDWENDKLFLDSDNEIVADTLEAYGLGFSPNYITNKIVIVRLQDEYQLKEKVNIGAEVLSINNIDVSNFSTAELCDFWKGEKEKINKKEVLEMVILDDGVRKNIKLTKKRMLPK